MRVSSLVYATDQGLGILAKSFCDNGIVTDPVVVAHGRHHTHLDWYHGAPVLADLSSPTCRDVAYRTCGESDAVLFFETPHIWELVPYCRHRGVKTVLMVMHECTHQRAFHPTSRPDLYLCPSQLDVQQALGQGADPAQVQYLPVPVSVPWRQRTRCETFVHNAGHGGLRGRNGTSELLQSFRYLKCDAKFIIRSQDTDWHEWKGWRGVDIRVGTVPYDQLWDEGDCFVFPEKFNGLSLPLQEARAAGMLVMGTDRFPMNEWLPRDPLIQSEGYVKARVGPPYLEFDEAVVSPRAIAAKIDEWYGRDITDYSFLAKAWSDTVSWGHLGPQYAELLRKVVGH